MEIAIPLTMLAGAAGAWRWIILDKATLADRIAHRLLAYAAGLRAQDAAVKAAMKQVVRLEAGDA